MFDAVYEVALLCFLHFMCSTRLIILQHLEERHRLQECLNTLGAGWIGPPVADSTSKLGHRKYT